MIVMEMISIFPRLKIINVIVMVVLSRCCCCKSVKWGSLFDIDVCQKLRAVRYVILGIIWKVGESRALII